MGKEDLFLVIFIDKRNSRGDRFVEKLSHWLDEESCTHTIEVVDLENKCIGRGSVLKKLWGSANADILAYMDVYSMLDLRIMKDILTALSGKYDVVTGSRLLSASKGKRRFLRKWISICYNFFVRKMFKMRWCTDVQCHVKAAKREVAQRLIPQIKSNDSFFDTELMVLSQRNKLHIKEVPIAFVDPAESMADVFKYFIENIVNIIRMKRTREIKEV